MDKPRRSRRYAQDDDSKEKEEEEEESEEEEEEDGDAPDATGLSRPERRELKQRAASDKAKRAEEDKQSKDDGGGDGDDLFSNPNHVTKKLNISDLSAPPELTRREREQKEKKEAQDRYWKLHVQGKTDQARADLSRLAKIRAEREAAAAKRKAEAEEKAKALEAARVAPQSSKR
ncbi:casein kinase substrate phosphoprotein PP28-domain-containing protein [Russula earlei]|uniref:Casein kinase substrate phosphoprotein PP28-domain-containing protein n=1 Tax=Russula earlei TaxID=71964 RepID=A0ACC0U8V1_9AGAM|nr:casein kinase substrate phosphoprotein PP28-domain-containing protein [Russula earlei]